jgi:hypothetical protein
LVRGIAGLRPDSFVGAQYSKGRGLGRALDACGRERYRGCGTIRM